MERDPMTMDGWGLGMEYVSTHGRVRWDVFGAGPPLVLVHGTPFSSYVWRKVVPALAETNTVYAFDLPGYGSSEKREGQDVSLAAQGRVLCELLDHWGLDKPAVAGHDFGGAITLRAHLLEGRDFRAIALIDAVALSLWGSPFYRQISQNDPRYTDEMQPLYARIERPVMIVWGEEDRWIPLRKGEQLHKVIPGSQLRTIPRCAHLAQEDAPEAVAEFLTEFFAP